MRIPLGALTLGDCGVGFENYMSRSENDTPQYFNFRIEALALGFASRDPRSAVVAGEGLEKEICQVANAQSDIPGGLTVLTAQGPSIHVAYGRTISSSDTGH